jgi:hypothetical protein
LILRNQEINVTQWQTIEVSIIMMKNWTHTQIKYTHNWTTQGWTTLKLEDISKKEESYWHKASLLSTESTKRAKLQIKKRILGEIHIRNSIRFMIELKRPKTRLQKIEGTGNRERPIVTWWVSPSTQKKKNHFNLTGLIR